MNHVGEHVELVHFGHVFLSLQTTLGIISTPDLIVIEEYMQGVQTVRRFGQSHVWHGQDPPAMGCAEQGGQLWSTVFGRGSRQQPVTVGLEVELV